MYYQKQTHIDGDVESSKNDKNDKDRRIVKNNKKMLKLKVEFSRNSWKSKMTELTFVAVSQPIPWKYTNLTVSSTELPNQWLSQSEIFNKF